MADDPILSEYYKLLDIVGEFDQRLLTVKSWGVTLSLTALGLAFQFRASGYFAVAFVSALAFWLIEGSMKSHQMRYYPRMREIEVIRSRVAERADSASPRIDWSWSRARGQLLGRVEVEPSPPRLRGKSPGYRWRYFAPTVLFPHVATMILGGFLFGWSNLDPQFWPAMPSSSAPAQGPVGSGGR